MVIALLQLFGGLLVLIKAADWMVDGAVGVARRLGVPRLVVGVPIVAYGTSLPEFVVSLLSARRGVVDFAIGNIVGSNICNIGLVLGSAALIHPIAVRGGTLFRRDLPVLTAVTAFSVWAFSDGVVERWEALLLVSVAVVYTIVSLRTPEDASTADDAEQDPGAPWPKSAALLLIGLLGMVVGANLMVEGGTVVAQSFGVSERIIGLTVVAVGTSLPEFAASVAGAAKGHAGLAVGNVVGSCLFNLAFVLGAAGAIAPLPVHFDSMLIDLSVMGALTLAMWVMLATGQRMTRIEGIFLLMVYVAFIGWLVTQAMATMTLHPAAAAAAS
ncbi:MAG: calcium/sodium antiporter [Myxococcales bacterium]|nr:calcium/sodium antiporter [Myxococcales bacterium]